MRDYQYHDPTQEHVGKDIENINQPLYKRLSIPSIYNYHNDNIYDMQTTKNTNNLNFVNPLMVNNGQILSSRNSNKQYIDFQKQIISILDYRDNPYNRELINSP